MCVLNNLTPHTRRREATKGQRAQQAAMAVFEDDVLGYVQNKSQIKTMCYWYVIVTYVVTCVCSTKGGCAQQMASVEDDLYGYVVMFAFKCLGMLLYLHVGWWCGIIPACGILRVYISCLYIYTCRHNILKYI